MALPQVPTVLMERQDAQYIQEWQRAVVDGYPVHRGALALKLLEEVFELCFAAGVTTEEVRIAWEAGERKALEQLKAFGHYFPEDVREEVGDVASSFGVFCYYANVEPAVAVSATVDKIQSHVWYRDEFGILRREK